MEFKGVYRFSRFLKRRLDKRRLKTSNGQVKVVLILKMSKSDIGLLLKRCLKAFLSRLKADIKSELLEGPALERAQSLSL